MISCLTDGGSAALTGGNHNERGWRTAVKANKNKHVGPSQEQTDSGFAKVGFSVGGVMIASGGSGNERYFHQAWRDCYSQREPRQSSIMNANKHQNLVEGILGNTTMTDAPAVISMLPPKAAMLLAVEIVLSDPETLGVRPRMLRVDFAGQAEVGLTVSLPSTPMWLQPPG